MSKVKKVRTAITIDPEILNQVREIVEPDESGYKSVSAFIEQACKAALFSAKAPRSS